MRDKVKLRATQWRWMKKRRDTWFVENGPCVKCGSLVDLELDHIDPNSKISHNVWSWADEKRLAELAKCQVLCKLCHKTKSDQGLRRPITHGTSTGYNKGCRCSSCTAHHVTRNKSYKLRIKKAAMVQ